MLQKNNFDDSTSTYEIKKQHHDHLICTECGKIIEFIDEDLEVMQEKISKKHNFKLTSHVMTLFGKWAIQNVSIEKKLRSASPF